MSDFQKLNIILAARDREFARAMDRNTKRVERFTRDGGKGLGKMGQQFNTLALAAKSLLPALSAAAVTAQVRQVTASLDEIGKTADRIGITTDALQELRTVAESAGIAQATLDKSLAKLSLGLGQAQQGSGEAGAALKQLGLNAAQLSSLGLDEALSRVADRMAAIEDPTLRAAAATKLFGEEGAGMVNLLREGSDGMDRMRAEARELGIVIDEKLIRNAEDAQTKLDLMSRVISAQVSSALINLAPLLVNAAQGIAGIAREINLLLNVGNGSFLPPLTDAEGLRAGIAEYAGLESELAAVTQAQAAYNESLERFGADSAQAASWATRLADAQQGLADAQAAAAAQQRAHADTRTAIQGLSADLADARERARLAGMTAEAAERERIAKEKTAYLERITTSAGLAGRDLTAEELAGIRMVADEWERAEIAASRVLNPQAREGGGSKGKGEAEREAEKAARDAAREVEQLQGNLADLQEKFGTSGVAALGYDAALAQLTAQHQAGKITAEQFADGMEKIESEFDAAAEAARSLEQAAEDTMVSIVTGSQSASDAVSGLLKQLAQMAAKAAFSGMFGGTFDGLGGLLSLDGARAKGGPVNRGGRYLVGEEGPEIFSPGRSGEIIPNDQLRGGGGGGGVQVTYAPVIDARGADAGAVARLERAQAQLVAEFEGRTIRAVQSAQKKRIL